MLLEVVIERILIAVDDLMEVWMSTVARAMKKRIREGRGC